MDAPHQTFADLASFCATLEREGITKVVVRRVHEIRPRALEKHQVEVGLQRWTELAAYGEGVLYTARLLGAEAAPIEADLKQRGYTVRSVVGNLS